jgi:hypothetical protein
MKKILPFLSLILMMGLLDSCSVVGGIFKAGVWIGVIIVLVVIGFIIWLVTRKSGNS